MGNVYLSAYCHGCDERIIAEVAEESILTAIVCQEHPEAVQDDRTIHGMVPV